MPVQQQWPFSKPLEFLQKVKYGGAVGKLTVIAVAAILMCGVAMVSSWGQEHVAFVALALVFVIVVGVFYEIRKTLERHPQLALMDGAEIVTLRKIELAAKNSPILPIDAQPMQDPSQPPERHSAEEEEED